MKQIWIAMIAMLLCGMLADMANSNNMEYTAGAFLALSVNLFIFIFLSMPSFVKRNKI